MPTDVCREQNRGLDMLTKEEARCCVYDLVVPPMIATEAMRADISGTTFPRKICTAKQLAWLPLNIVWCQILTN